MVQVLQINRKAILWLWLIYSVFNRSFWRQSENSNSNQRAPRHRFLCENLWTQAESQIIEDKYGFRWRKMTRELQEAVSFHLHNVIKGTTSCHQGGQHHLATGTRRLKIIWWRLVADVGRWRIGQERVYIILVLKWNDISSVFPSVPHYSQLQPQISKHSADLPNLGCRRIRHGFCLIQTAHSFMKRRSLEKI